jgi:phenylacetate-coenzyme A ligase PaaK-like adenylate-forming protein
MESQWLSWDEIHSIQMQKLRDILDYATACVPHYRGVIGAQDPDIASIDDLRQIPTLSKQELKQIPDKIRSTEPLRGLSKKTTSGSTGEPFSLRKDVAALEQEIAATWRGYGWTDIEVGDRQGRFWGVPQNSRDLWKSRLSISWPTASESPHSRSTMRAWPHVQSSSWPFGQTISTDTCRCSQPTHAMCNNTLPSRLSV